MKTSGANMGKATETNEAMASKKWHQHHTNVYKWRSMFGDVWFGTILGMFCG